MANPYFPRHECHGIAIGQNLKPIGECRLHHYVRPAGTLEQAIASYQLTAEHLWMTFQKEAEDVVKVNGAIIADDTERNRRINAAYAKLWLADHRFQWAGLAAFASKQVGRGLLHARHLAEQERDELKRVVNWAGSSTEAAGMSVGPALIGNGADFIYSRLAFLYNDARMQEALAANQLAWAIAFPSGVYMEIQLTLSAQCKAKDGWTAYFPRLRNAKLWVVEERMKFVYLAAARFDELLKGSQRPYVEASLHKIAAGGGVE